MPTRDFAPTAIYENMILGHTSTTRKPQVSVHVYIHQGPPFWSPMFDHHPLCFLLRTKTSPLPGSQSKVKSKRSSRSPGELRPVLLRDPALLQLFDLAYGSTRPDRPIDPSTHRPIDRTGAGSTPAALGADSLSMPFNHPSFQKLAVFPGFPVAF